MCWIKQDLLVCCVCVCVCVCVFMDGVVKEVGFPGG